MRAFRRTVTVLALALALIAAGCGDDDDATTTTAPTPSPEESDTDRADIADDDGPGEAANDEGSPSGAPGPGGSVTVDGTTHAIDDVMLCELEDPERADLDLVGFGNQVRVFLVIEDLVGFHTHGIDYEGPEGIFSNWYSRVGDEWIDDLGDYLSDTPIVIDGNRVTAQGTLLDVFDSGDTVEVTVDLPLPSSTTDCS